MAHRKLSGSIMSSCRGSAGDSFGRTSAILLIFSLLSALTATSSGQQTHELVTTYEGGWIQDGVMFDVQTTAIPGNDAAAVPDGITIHGLNLLTPLTEPFCVELYTKSGTFSSDASNSAAWTFLGSFSIDGQGPSSPTSIPLGAFDPITVGLGDTQAFYVTTQNEKLRYTALDPNDYVTGDVYSSSDPHFTSTATARGVDEAAEDGGEDKGSKEQGRGNDKGGRGGRGDGGRGKKGRARDDSDRSLQADGLSVQILTGVAKNYPFAESWPHRVFNGALLYTLGADSSLSLTEAQVRNAWNAKRGYVTCDIDATPIESYPSVAPSDPRYPTESPMKITSSSPSKSPTPSPSASPTTLESTIEKVATTLHGGLKQSGCMFDIRVPSVAKGGPPEGVTVIALEMSTFLTEEICVEVYSKSGTYEGFEQDVVQNADGTWTSPTWSVLGAATVTGKGEKSPTHLPIGALDPVYIGPGERRAFYVTMTTPEMRYTEPRFGEQSGTLFSGSPKGHLELMVGSAVAYPFEEVWEDRIFNGAVVYTLGDIGDSKYNQMTSDDRDRSCPMPTGSPTGEPSKDPTKLPTSLPSKDPTKLPTPPPSSEPTAAPTGAAAIVVENGGEVIGTDPTEAGTEAAGTEATATEAAATEAAVTVATATVAAVPGPSETGSGDVVDAIQTSEPTLAAAATTSSPTQVIADNSCPAAASSESTTKDVLVPYEYALVTKSSSTGTSMIVAEMETALHNSLVLKKCSINITGGGRRKKMRMLQEISYQGFNSSPVDQVSNEGCGDDVAVLDGQECYLVLGGVTAVVESDADDDAVKADVGAFAESVLVDPNTYQLLGAQEVVYIAPDSYSSAGGSAETDTDTDTDTDTSITTTDGKGASTDLEIVGAIEGDQETIPDVTKESKGLSTTGIIIIAVLCVTLAVVILAFVAVHVRKKRRLKRADSKELFQEFPDEEERAYGIGTNTYGLSASSSGGYKESLSPLSSSILSQPPPPPPPRGASAVILNEQDDISLFSNAKSKSRFGPSAMLAPPDSPGSRRSQGSRGSKGSSSSKKSVEFVRAGQSFSSRQSNQPEDTVDL